MLARDARHKTEIDIDEQIPLERTSWIAARATGPWHRLILNDIQAFAHTSPVYVRFGDERVLSLEDARFYDAWIEKLIASVNERGRFLTAEHRQEVIELFRSGQRVYQQLEQQARQQAGATQAQ